MLGIVYKATNLINGKLYVGKTTKTLRERYAGNPTVGWGKRRGVFPAAVRKYGWESFKFEVIDTSNDPKELSNKEIMWIKNLDCRVPNGYNLTAGGEGLNGYKCSEEHRRRVSEHHKKAGIKPPSTRGCKYSKERCLAMSISSKSKCTCGHPRGAKFGEPHLESCPNFSPSQKGKKITWRHGMLGRKMSAEIRQRQSLMLKANPHRGMLGKKHSSEAIEKIRDANYHRTYKPHTEEAKAKMGTTKRANRLRKLYLWNTIVTEDIHLLSACLAARAGA